MPFRARIGWPHLAGRVATLRNRLSRARYFRGHGVHSPFVYALVRCVFMAHGPLSEEHALHDALMACGVPPRRALELQNLMVHCGYCSFRIDAPGADLCVATPALSVADTLELIRHAAVVGSTVAVLEPYADRDRRRLCGAIVAGHGSTSIDNRGYLLVFNTKRMPKQHFKI